MKYITKFFGVGCVALLAMLFMAPGAFAQTTYYVDPDNGGTDTAACASTATDGGYPNPCLLNNAVVAASTAGDIILIRVRRSGGSVSLAAPTAALGSAQRYGVYVRGSGDRVKGTLEFTGNFQIASAGLFELDSLATVQFEDVTLTEARTATPLVADPAPNEKNPASRVVISGTLTITDGGTSGAGATIGALVVAEDLAIERPADATTTPTLRIDSLVVNSGATLTLGKAGSPVDLRVPLKKAAKDDLEGILTVNGEISGPGKVWIAHLANATSAGRGAPENTGTTPVTPADDYFHMSSDYMPDSKGVVDHEDCVSIAGSGEITSDLLAIAAGNICVGLGKIADLTVAGSIAEPGGGSTEGTAITTDVIFRNNVEVDGDVVQWNDARVVFEKNVTVTGNVILEDGTLPTSTFRETTVYGAARTRTGTAEDGPDGETVVTSVRTGVKLASAAEDVEFTCNYRSTMDEVRVVDTPVVSLSLTTATVTTGTATLAVNEDVTTVTVTATLNKAHPEGTSITIPLKVATASTATAASGSDLNDYTLPGAFEITISSGTTGTVDITITDDGDEEPAETIIVELGELPPTVRQGATSSVTITINASDPTVNVFVDDGTSDVRFFKNQNTATAGRGFYIPGVHFQGVAMIQGDLDVRSDEITAQDSNANRNATRCAPRVIFAAAPVKTADAAMMSHIMGDVVIEEVRANRILLDADKSSGNKISAHNLSLDGDIFDAGDSIEMEEAAESLDKGMCTNTLSLNAGTRLVLTDARAHFIVGAATLDALVIQEDLDFQQDGDVEVETLHVGAGADLEAGTDKISISKGLILEGELDGTLKSGSLSGGRLVYATVNTDIVAASSLESLSVQVESGELRLDQVTGVKNLGLCRGNVVLFEAGGENDSTLNVTDQITVKDGMLALDGNNPGSIGTDVSKPAVAADGYILMYVTEGARAASREWFAPRDVVVNHKDADITVNEAKTINGKLHILKGNLRMMGDLTVGASSVASQRFLRIHDGELHSNGNNVIAHDEVEIGTTDKEVARVMTGNGNLQVLGNISSAGVYATNTAMATVAEKGVVNVGTGALQLGPAYDKKVDDLTDDGRPGVSLTVKKGGTVTGRIDVPKGSKKTSITGEKFDVIVLDATANPKATASKPANWGGSLLFHDTKVEIDSLAAMNDGAVEFYDQTDPKTDKYAITITKDVSLSSARIYVNGQNTLKFDGDLTISGTGGLTAWDQAKVTVAGNFMQNEGAAHAGAQDGLKLSGDDNTFTAMKNFAVTEGAHRVETSSNSKLVLKGHFHLAAAKMGSDKMLNADLEFSGEKSQTVSSSVDLGDVVINNAAGIELADSVAQAGTSTLTLTRGIISGSDHAWTVKNTDIEEDVRGRNNALMTCATDANCDSVIKGGSRRAHSSAGVSRHVMHGNSGGGELSGGYLFPVGDMDGDRAHYRPLVLQLEDDLSSAVPVTVTPMRASEDKEPSWPADNIVVPIQQGSSALYS